MDDIKYMYTLSLPHPLPALKYNLIPWFNSRNKILPLKSPKSCLKLAKVIFKTLWGLSFLVFINFNIID